MMAIQKVYIFIFVFLLSFYSIQAQILEKMLGTTATFTDVAVIIYESFNPINLVKAQKDNKINESRKEASFQEMNDYLKTQGIDISLKSQPISKQEFARILFQRFKFSSSLLTRTSKLNYLYFRDARNIGIFDNSDNENDTLTTTEMFQSYFKALQITK